MSNLLLICLITNLRILPSSWIPNHQMIQTIHWWDHPTVPWLDTCWPLEELVDSEKGSTLFENFCQHYHLSCSPWTSICVFYCSDIPKFGSLVGQCCSSLRIPTACCRLVRVRLGTFLVYILKLTNQSPFCSALARKYGKRPQYLFGCTMALIGTIVCVVSGSNYSTLLAGRLLQGFGTTPFESLSLAAIGDM